MPFTALTSAWQTCAFIKPYRSCISGPEPWELIDGTVGQEALLLWGDFFFFLIWFGISFLLNWSWLENRWCKALYLKIEGARQGPCLYVRTGGAETAVLGVWGQVKLFRKKKIEWWCATESQDWRVPVGQIHKVSILLGEKKMGGGDPAPNCATQLTSTLKSG